MPDPARLLRIVHEDEDTETPLSGAVAVLPGSQLTRAEQAKATAAHAARQGWHRFAASGERDGALLHALLTYRARSTADHAGHASSRAWVPPGCEDGWIEEWGMHHHRWVALPGTLLGHAWIGVIQSPLATAEALAVFASIVVPLALMIGFFAAVGVVATVLAVAAFAACAATVREGKS